MIDTPRPPSPIVADWMRRHRDRRSLALHVLGIPPTLLGVLLIPVYTLGRSLPVFVLALGLFVGGYLLQFLGHACDGTEPGEVRGVRTWWARRRGPRPDADAARVPTA